MRYPRRRDCREHEQQPAARVVARRAVDEQRSLAAAIGNHAFSAMVARSGEQAATTTARWSAPLDFGIASNAFEASMALAGIRAEAGVLVQAGFERLDEFATEAEIWQDQLGWLARALTQEEVESLAELSEEFESAYTAALTDLAATLARQVEPWTAAPMSDDDLVPLRETVHRRFVDSEDEAEIEAASELVGESIEGGGGRVLHRVEQALSKYAQQKYGHSFVFLTNYLAADRPFYTMREEAEADQPVESRSFDLLWRGLEITSGAQREHRHERLRAQIADSGLESDAVSRYLDPYYLDMFRYGCPPHGGFGFGVNRLVMSLLAQPSMRETSFVFRGPGRFVP